MKLPSLSDLDLDAELSEFENEIPKKKPARKARPDDSANPSPTRASPSKPSLPQKRVPTESKVDKIKKEKEREGKPKIPKSQYDSDGNPLLSIPDLNDIDLSREIDRFFD